MRISTRSIFHIAYCVVPFRDEFLLESVEGVSLGADWEAAELPYRAEEMRGAIQTILADIDILLLHSFWSPWQQ